MTTKKDNGDATLHRRRSSGCGQLKLLISARVSRRPALLFWVGPPLGNIIPIDVVFPKLQLFSQDK
jgi:hypothetical protein